VSPEEYSKLSQIEKRHWFYSGKREIVRYWIWKHLPKSRNLTLLDCGAGGGAFASEMSADLRVTAMDDHEESLELLRASLPPGGVVRGGCTQIPFPEDSFDIVTALDVLEHIPDDRKAVAEMIRVLKPGGILVLTVPALMSLWSDWDVSLHHQRRYLKNNLLPLMDVSVMRCIHAAYINVLAVPAIWLVRRVRSMGLGTRTRAEDWVPPLALNALLRFLFVSLGKSRMQFPFGVGLLYVGMK
jgi:2-polyprenyl-3-methyl-5-hydroxy-6-metoxy-1,4-benzoquinol methylase